jgi:DNA-binding NarL/FixJ family response regulator
MESPEPESGRSRRVRLVIADDHPVFLEGLAGVLCRQGDFEIVGLAASGEEAVAAWKRYKPDVLVLDLMMPGLDGLAALRLLHGLRAIGRVLVLSSSDDPADAEAAIAAGAAGYVTKAARYDDIVAAIRDVHAGRRPLLGLLPRHAAASVVLTPREQDVLALVAMGLTYAEIGRRLRIAQRTARSHVVAIQHKLRAANNAQVVDRAYRLGLLRKDSTPPSAAMPG